jgi:hypothetical protein
MRLNIKGIVLNLMAMGYWVWVKTGIIIVPFFQIYRENEEKIASGSDFLSEPGLWIAPNPE